MEVQAVRAAANVAESQKLFMGTLGGGTTPLMGGGCRGGSIACPDRVDLRRGGAQRRPHPRRESEC